MNKLEKDMNDEIIKENEDWFDEFMRRFKAHKRKQKIERLFN